jgi:hypothetical protein
MWAFPTSHTFMVVGSAREWSHPINTRELSSQVLKLDSRCKNQRKYHIDPPDCVHYWPRK